MTSGGDMTRAVRSAGKRLKPAVAAGAIGAAALVGLCGPHPALAQSGSVTVTVTLSVTATATVDTAKVQTATQAAIQGLMGARARFLTSNGPDTTRIHDRLSGGTLTGRWTG